jgi:hypothetical protein
MAHFARVENGIVKQVIVAEQDYIDNLVSDAPGEWIQTSYNTYGGIHYVRNEDGTMGDASDDQTKALRKNYAGVGSQYDATADAFYLPQPYPSWTLNTTSYLWESPVALPSDAVQNGGSVVYLWNEETQTWDAVESE